MSKIAIAFLLTFFSGIYAAFAIDVAWGVNLYLFQYFLNPILSWWAWSLPGLRYTMVAALCIVISYVVHKQKYQGLSVFESPVTKWFILNWIMFAMISFWAVWPEAHLDTLFNHTKLLILFSIAYKVVGTVEKYESLIWTYILGNFYMGWVVRSQGRGSSGRVELIGPIDSRDANSAAAILCASVLVVMFYVLKSKGLVRKFILILALAFILNGVILINSRGSIIALGLAGVYVIGSLLLNMRIRVKVRLQVLGVGVLLGVLFVYLSDPQFWERMATVIDRMGTPKESGGPGGRTLFWKAAWGLAQENPMGLGTWAFQYLSPELLPPELLSNGRRAVHSTYFQCLVERGYLGFLVFLALILSNFNLLRKVKKAAQKSGQLMVYFEALTLEGAFVAFLMASIFINRLHAEILYWHMLFIVCFGNIHLLKRNKTMNIQGDPATGKKRG